MIVAFNFVLCMFFLKKKKSVSCLSDKYLYIAGEALDCLVSIQTRLGEDDKAIVALLKRVLKIQELTFGHESEEVMETLKKIIHCLDKLGMRIEKLPVERRFSNLWEKYKDMIAY